MIIETEEEQLNSTLSAFNVIEESEEEQSLPGPNIEPDPTVTVNEDSINQSVKPADRNDIQVPLEFEPAKKKFDYNSIGNLNATEYVPRGTNVPELTPAGSLWKANIAEGTTWGYFSNNRSQRDYKLVDRSKFNFLDYIPEDLRAYPAAFALDMSEEQILETASVLRQEQFNQETMAENPWQSAIVGFATQVIDPVNLLPGGLLYRNFKKASLTTRAMAGAAISNVATTSIQEGLLQSSQLSRTSEESLWNIAASGILGGALGGAIGKIGELNVPKKPSLGESVAGYKRTEDYQNRQSNIDLLNRKLHEESQESRPAIKEKISAEQRELDDIIKRLLENERINYDIHSQTNITPGYNSLDTKSFEQAHEQIVGIFEERPVPVNENGLLADTELENMPEWTKKLMFGTPLNRSKNGRFKTASAWADLFIESNYNTVKNAKFDTPGNAAETQLKLIESKLTRVMSDFQQQYFDMLNIKGNYFKQARASFAKPDMSYDEFLSRATQAIYSKVPDANPHVNKAAEIWSTQLIDATTKELVEFDLLPEGITPKTAPAYFTIVPNKQKIIEQGGSQAWGPGTYPQTIYEKFKQTQDQIKSYKKTPFYISKSSEIDRLLAANKEKKIDKSIKKSNEERISALEEQIMKAGDPYWFNDKGKLRDELPDEVLIARARQVVDRQLAQQGDKILNPILERLTSTNPKQLKERTLMIDQADLHEWHIKDPVQIGKLYIRAMSPILAVNRIARKHGYKNLAEMQEEFGKSLKSEYDELAKGKSGKESAKLEKEFRQAIEDMNSTIEILQGVYGQGDNVLSNELAVFARNFRTYTGMRFLGAMVISSFSDVGQNVFRNGPYQFIHHGLMPVVRSLDGISRRDLRAIGRGIESEIGGGIRAMLDREGLTTNPGIITKSFDYLADSFGNATGMNAWNSIMQRIAGSVSFNRTLDTISKVVEGKHVSAIDRKRVANLGINEKYFPYIYSQTKDNIDSVTGSRYADWSSWRVNSKFEADALNEFQAGTLKDIDNTVLRPGIGDKPLLAHTELGKMVFQFKSFMFAATNKILYSGIQRRHDANIYAGITTMLAMGAMSYVTMKLLRGEEPDLSFKNLSMEAIDRSGLLGIFGEVYNIGQKAGLIPGEGVSRYYSRGILGSLVGPSLGSLEDLTYLLNRGQAIGAGDSELTTSDLQKGARFVPWQNMFYVQGLNNAIITKVAESTDIEETRKGY